MLHPFDILMRPKAEQRAREAEGLSIVEQREEKLRKLLNEAEARYAAEHSRRLYGDDPEDRIATIITMLKFNTALMIGIAVLMTTALAVGLTAIIVLG